MPNQQFHQSGFDQPSLPRFLVLFLPKLFLVAAQGVLSLLLWPLYWFGKKSGDIPPTCLIQPR